MNNRFCKFCFGVLVIVLICCQSGCVSSFDVTSDIQEWPASDEQSSDSFKEVCEAARQTGKSEFMVSCGDVVPPGRVYDVVNVVFGPDYIWYPVVGNHNSESPERMQWLRDYAKENLSGIVQPGPAGCEETTYSFNFKNAHIIVLNEYYDGKSDMGTDGDMCDSLYQWLKKDLEANRKPFVFVFGHEPFVVIGDIDSGRVRHTGNNLSQYPENIHRVLTLFRKHNVTAYLCGHTHNFSYAKINGTWHINAGHSMGNQDTGASSTFLKVNMGPFRCRVDVYRFDKKQNGYRRNHVVDLN